MPEPTIKPYRYYWPPDSSSSLKDQILHDDAVIPCGSSGRSSSNSKGTMVAKHANFTGRGVRQSIDEVELFDDDNENWMGVAAKRRLPSKVMQRRKSMSSSAAGSSSGSSATSSGNGTLLLLTQKKRKQAKIDGFVRQR